ncbi:hypothetical protein J2801_001601 [Paraburkholderia phenoliruptrix]|nr:hypothetical protein [Paraburkholderia phenoliruptrix]
MRWTILSATVSVISCWVSCGLGQGPCAGGAWRRRACSACALRPDCWSRAFCHKCQRAQPRRGDRISGMFRRPSLTLPIRLLITLPIPLRTSFLFNRQGSRPVSRSPHLPPFAVRRPSASRRAEPTRIDIGAPLAGRTFLACCAAFVVAAVLVMPAPAAAKSAASTQPGTQGASADAKAASDATASTASLDSEFDARQKALDQRTEENNYRYGVAEHNCYSNFFVNHCLNKARDEMRTVQAQIRKEQLALDGEERAERARKRDEQAALKRAQDEASAPQRAAEDARNAQAYEEKQRQHELDQAQRNAEAPQRSANAEAYEEKQRQHAIDQAQRGISPSEAAANQRAYDQKQGDFQRKLEEARRQGAQKAQERVEKQQSFAKKQAEAAQHKADVEARQKQAAEKAEQKRQEQLKQQKQLEEQQRQQQQPQQ